MSKLSYFSRYMLILQRLQRSDATFEEISDHLELNDQELLISKRTFQRDIKEICSLFDVDIEFDFSKRIYKLDDAGQPDFSKRMLEAFDMFHAMNMSENLSHYVHFEKRKPHGTEHFTPILQAIQKHHIIKFQYCKFWEDIPTERIIEPYALKESMGRWYLVAREPGKDIIKTFGLDRISEIETTKKTYKYPKELDIDGLYGQSFGVINTSDTGTLEIILSFSYDQGMYIKTYPLHGSQEVVADNEEELKVKLNLHPTFDFIMELLSFGDEMEVISPKSLRKTMKERIKNMLKLYK